MTDIELDTAIVGLSGGDMEALKSIYDSCGHAVYSLAISLLHNHHAAEDAMQETFMKIWCGASSYKQGRRPMAWIMSIAHNVAVDSLRKQSHESVSDQGNLPDSAQPVDRSAEDHLCIGHALELLPECDREIIVMRVLSGLSYREVCRILGIPPGTAAWKYARGIKKLRALLSDNV
jgi:RNA polymerase sigma-70 factor (ECF subfamily)